MWTSSCLLPYVMHSRHFEFKINSCGTARVWHTSLVSYLYVSVASSSLTILASRHNPLKLLLVRESLRERSSAGGVCSVPLGAMHSGESSFAIGARSSSRTEVRLQRFRTLTIKRIHFHEQTQSVAKERFVLSGFSLGGVTDLCYRLLSVSISTYKLKSVGVSVLDGM